MNKFSAIHERFVCVFFVFLMFALFTFELTFTRQYLEEQSNSNIHIHIGFACILLVNVLSAFFLLFRTNCSTKGLVLPSGVQSGWFYCHDCQSSAPPRSYHCHKCRQCILRRDHHCVFSACCIGQTNYRYYMALLFQIFISITYASALHFEFVFYHLNKGWTVSSVLSQFAPVMLFIFGQITLKVAIINLLVFVCYCGWFFTGGLFLYHFRILMRNQTTYERVQDIHIYSLKNWRLNLEEILGSRWPLSIFVSPLISSPLPGDGLHFDTLDTHKYSQ